MAKGGKDKPGHHQLELYGIQQAFKHIDASMELTLEQKAGLEFAYLEALAHRQSGGKNSIPNLERYVELNPELFVQVIVWAYRRRDEGVDPPEFRVAPENIKFMAERGYKLLDSLDRIPGHNDLDQLETPRLAKWVDTVRDSCAQLSRSEIGDVCIGRLLSSASAGRGSVWPCEEVRDVMEAVRSDAIMRGAHTGLYNARGVHWRGDGGARERELADKYRRWAETLQFTHP